MSLVSKSLDSFPTELLYLIVIECSIETLRSLLLTNKALSKLAQNEFIMYVFFILTILIIYLSLFHPFLILGGVDY